MRSLRNRRWRPGPALLVLVVALAAAGAPPAGSSSTMSATPIDSSTCPQTVSGSVRLETDLICTNTSGLIVGADNTVIDLNGHTITCVAPGDGYAGSCQGTGANGALQDSDTPEVGVDSNNHDNVHVFSHVDGGTIDGFDRGVFVRADSDNAKVRQLTITGPPVSTGFRPPVFGAVVEGDHCRGGIVRVDGNVIDHQTTGIRVNNASCVYVGSNVVRDNTGADPAVAVNAGIRIRNSSTNQVRGNLVIDNGNGVVAPPPPDSGIVLDGPTAPATGNLIVGNSVNGNDGEGIATDTGASGNDIVNNDMRSNTKFDAFSEPTESNNWSNNNHCNTQTTPQPPAGVCNPGE